MASSCPDVPEPESDQKPEQGEGQGQGQGEQAQRQLDKPPFRCVVPCADYSYDTPLAPFIDIRVPRRSNPGGTMELEPSYDGIDPSLLTSEDLHIITQSSKQLAYDDDCCTWEYEDRHSAQPVLDFLYLGPTSIIRDYDFLSSNDITMMVVVLYSRTVTSLRTVDQASRELGLPVEYVRFDGSNPSNLIQTLPSIIGLINRHLLSVRRDTQSATGRAVGDEEPDDAMMAETPRFLRGKVLVTCDTGNHQSAIIVAAYVMSVFGQNMVSAVQFTLLKRFSCDFQDDAKLMLQSWEEIIRARSMTAHHHLQTVREKESCLQDGEDTPPALLAASNRKRGVDDMAGDCSMSGGGEASATDEARFLDRRRFVPFADLYEVG